MRRLRVQSAQNALKVPASPFIKMKIGIISDTHDNVQNILRAVKIFKDKEVKLVLHCGDVISPKSITFFKGVVVKFVAGNCDGDIHNLKEKAATVGSEYLGEIAEIVLEKKKILVYHGQDKQKLDKFIKSLKYNYVLTGHTHQLRDERVGETRVLNPGAHYYGSSDTVMLLDLANDEVEVIKL